MKNTIKDKISKLEEKLNNKNKHIEYLEQEVLRLIKKQPEIYNIGFNKGFDIDTYYNDDD